MNLFQLPVEFIALIITAIYIDYNHSNVWTSICFW